MGEAVKREGGGILRRGLKVAAWWWHGGVRCQVEEGVTEIFDFMSGHSRAAMMARNAHHPLHG
jgi:hypothetical protein